MVKKILILVLMIFLIGITTAIINVKESSSPNIIIPPTPTSAITNVSYSNWTGCWLGYCSLASLPIYNSSYAVTGNCPSGKVVMNTTNSGVQCVNINSTDYMPNYVLNTGNPVNVDLGSNDLITTGDISAGTLDAGGVTIISQTLSDGVSNLIMGANPWQLDAGLGIGGSFTATDIGTSAILDGTYMLTLGSDPWTLDAGFQATTLTDGTCSITGGSLSGCSYSTSNSSYVPYTGATSNVDLGTMNLVTGGNVTALRFTNPNTNSYTFLGSGTGYHVFERGQKIAGASSEDFYFGEDTDTGQYYFRGTGNINLKSSKTIFGGGSSDGISKVQMGFTDTSTTAVNRIGLYSLLTANPASASLANFMGFDGGVKVTGALSPTGVGAGAVGLRGIAIKNTNSNVNSMTALNSLIYMEGGTGILTNAYNLGVRWAQVSQTGKIINAYGVYIQDPSTLAQNFIGVYLDKGTASSNNTGIWLNGNGIGSDILFGSTNKSRIYHDGTNLIFETNATGLSGIAWFSANVSATNYITRTSAYDKSKGSALSNIKDTDDLMTGNKIDDSKFYGFVQYPVTDYSKPVIKIKQVEECNPYDASDCRLIDKEETTYPYTKLESGVDLGKEIDVLRQSLAEIKDCTKNSADWKTYQECVGK